MSTLHLRFCGTPEVQWQHQLLNFPARKALALLAYLVVEGDRQPRDKLAALLWPESDPSRARATLRNGLHQLRTTLPKEDYLHIERDALAFNFAAEYELDLDQVATVASSQDTAVLQNAVAAYRGDFLEGLTLPDAPEFDDWLRLQQEQWHRRIDIIYDRLARRQLEQGQTAAALDTAESWLAHNPLNEAAYRRLMRLYFVGGRRTAALEVYDHCLTMLAEELNAEPAPETAALAEQIRREQAVRPSARKGKVSPRAAIADGPLVGRGGEFRKLVAFFHHAQTGQPQAVRLLGEPGIGKTRLAHEFLAWARAQGSEILRGRSFESGRHLPYQPLVAALRPRLEQINAPEDLLSDSWLRTLSRLLPEIADRYPDLLTTDVSPPSSDEQTARTHLFEAITRLLLALVPRQAPLILFVDDLQWADAATLDVLQYVAQRISEQRAAVFLLCTVRSEAIEPELPVTRCWQQLDRMLSAETLHLTGLSEAETADFIQALGAAENSRFTTWLFRETAGQPFYLVETVKELLAQESLRFLPDEAGRQRLHIATVPHERDAVPVPQKIQQLINGRIARLTPPAADLLAASAVLAQGFGFDLLCRVAGIGQSEGLPALDELLQNQLLQEQGREEIGSASAPYIFTHDKIRQVAYEAAGSARRRIFHQRALAALADAAAPPAQLARHAVAAGDHAAGFQYSLAAGTAALQLHAVQEAITHLEQARKLYPLKKRNAEAQRRREKRAKALQKSADLSLQTLYLQLGRAYEIAGSYDQALAVYDELQALAQAQDDRPLQLAALMARTTVYAAPTHHYDPESVDILTQQALPLAQELEDHAAQAKILWNLMLLHIFTGNMQQALEHGEASLALAREHNLPEQLAYTLHDLFRPYLFCGHPEQAVDVLHESQAMWREMDNKPMLADSLNVLSGHYALIGEYNRAIEVGQEALQLSDEIDNVWNQSFGRMQLSFVYMDRGDYAKAIELMEASITLGEKAGFMIPMVLSGALLAWIYAVLGDLARGHDWAARALAQADEMHPSLRISPLATQGYLHLLAGEMAAAETAVTEALDLFSPDNNDPSLLIVPFAAVELALARQKPDEALVQLDRFFAILQARSLRIMTGLLYWLKGRALLALQRWEEAEAALAKGKQVAEKLESRPALWRVLAAQADLAETRGDEETAVSLRQQAMNIILTIADDLDDEALRHSFLQKTAAAFPGNQQH